MSTFPFPLTSLPPPHIPHPYTGQIVVRFEEDLSTGRLEAIRIQTDRLTLRPAGIEDRDAYEEIFGDAENMALYLGGSRTQEQTMRLLNMYADRWLGRGKYGGVTYPYSGFAIVYEDAIVGNIGLGNGVQRGEAQIGYAINRQFHHLGIAKESTAAIIHGLAPRLLERGFPINLHESDSSGDSLAGELQYIKATTSPKNTYSWYVLEDVGFSRKGYDPVTDRFDYRITQEEIVTRKV